MEALLSVIIPLFCNFAYLLILCLQMNLLVVQFRQSWYRSVAFWYPVWHNTATYQNRLSFVTVHLAGVMSNFHCGKKGLQRRVTETVAESSGHKQHVYMLVTKFSEQQSPCGKKVRVFMKLLFIPYFLLTVSMFFSLFFAIFSIRW